MPLFALLISLESGVQNWVNPNSHFVVHIISVRIRPLICCILLYYFYLHVTSTIPFPSPLQWQTFNPMDFSHINFETENSLNSVQDMNLENHSSLSVQSCRERAMSPHSSCRRKVVLCFTAGTGKLNSILGFRACLLNSVSILQSKLKVHFFSFLTFLSHLEKSNTHFFQMTSA